MEFYAKIETKKRVSKWLSRTKKRHYESTTIEKECAFLINKKRAFGAGITAVIFLLIIMVLTTPSKVELDQRALKESGIVCENMDRNERCRKDNQAVSTSSSHLKNVGIFTSYEKDFALENGEKNNR